MRWTALSATSIWYDEAFTWWVSLQSPSRIIEIIRADTWPPLYYLLMHVWIGLFGDGIWVMRAQAATASSVALALAGALAWRTFKTSESRLLAMLLLALSATQLQFARDVRCYATVSLLVVATIWCISRRVESGRRWWLAGYCLAAAALVYQHNVMWFYLASLHGAWLLWPGVQGAKARLRDMLIGDAVVALLFAPWAPSLIGQVRHLDTAFWTQRPVLYELTVVFNQAAGMQTFRMHDFAARFGVADPMNRLIRLPVFFLIVSSCLYAVLGTRGFARRRILSLIVAGLGPILMAFIYSQFRRSIFVDRCFAPSSLLLAIAIAGIAQTAWKWHARALGVVLTILCALSAALLLRYPEEEPWEQALSEVQCTSRDGDQLVFFAAEGELVYDYLVQQRDWTPIPAMGLPHDFQSGDPPRVQLPVRSPADLHPLDQHLALAATNRIVLIRAHDGGLDNAGLLNQYLRQHWQHSQTHRWPSITVEYYDRKP